MFPNGLWGEKARHKNETASLACLVFFYVNEAGVQMGGECETFGSTSRGLMSLELSSTWENWEIASNIEWNHVGQAVNDAELIQRPYQKRKL